MTEQFEFPFDLPEGRRLRDAGFARIIANNRQWFRLAFIIIDKLPKGWKGRAEEFRPLIVAAGGEPTKPNAYGRLTDMAIKRGLLRRLGTRSAMRRPSSHARSTDEYERC